LLIVVNSELAHYEIEIGFNVPSDKFGLLHQARHQTVEAASSRFSTTTSG
jgi:hypothetical protein